MFDRFAFEFGPVSSGTVAWLGVAADVAIKASALLALAFVAHVLLGPRRALVRSAVWNACLIGLLVLVPMSAAVPRLRLAVLPASNPAHQDSPTIVPSFPSASIETSDRDDPVPSRTVVLPKGRVKADVAVLAAIQERPHAGVAAPSTAPISRRIDPGLALLVAYALIVSLLTTRLAVSLAAVARLRRRADAVTDPSWVAALDGWRSRLGLARAVALLMSDEVSVPVAIGWLRPAIIVPRGLLNVNGPRDAVLLHELAHVRRGDYGWNLVRKLVQIVYAPHPLTWCLGRALGGVREQACDDLCVHLLGDAAGYRDALLDVAGRITRSRRPDAALGLGLAMARASRLGDRLRWIAQTPGTSRCQLPAPARWLVGGPVIALAALVGTLELTRAGAVPDATPVPVEAKLIASQHPDAKAAKADKSPAEIEVTVLAKETGRPIEGATIRPFIEFEYSRLMTDRDGHARIDLSRRKLSDSVSLEIWADGHVQQRFFFSEGDQRQPRIPERLTVELWPGEETVGGTVVNEENQPIAGALVELFGYLGSRKDPHEIASKVSTTTNMEGQWRLTATRGLTWAYLYLSHPDYLNDNPRRARPYGRIRPEVTPIGERPFATIKDFTSIETMVRGIEVAGRVTNEKGQPVPGAEVGWMAENETDTLHYDLPLTTTDQDGRFRFAHATPGRVVLQVMAKGHAPRLLAVVAKPAMKPVSITLDPPHTLTGRIVDSRGKPIEGVSVFIDTYRGYRSLGVVLSTNADGRFRWDDAPAESVLVYAGKSGHLELTDQRLTADDNAIMMTLKKLLSITGDVRDATTNRKIQDIDRIEVGARNAKSGEITWSENQRAYIAQGELRVRLDAEEAPEYFLRLQPRGYEPFVSRAFRSDEGSVKYNVALRPAALDPSTILEGVAHRPDGTPLAGAQVAVSYGSSARSRLPVPTIEDGAFRPSKTMVVATTDADGQFTITREPDPLGKDYVLVVVHPDYFAAITRDNFEPARTITARPWARVEGVARVGSRHAANTEILAYHTGPSAVGPNSISVINNTRTNDQGRFAFDRLVPGEVGLIRVDKENGTRFDLLRGVLVDVSAGATTRAEIGGRGRPLIARVKVPPGFDPAQDFATYSEFEIRSDRPEVPIPFELVAADVPFTEWEVDWMNTPEGRAYRRSLYTLHSTRLRPDGSIRVNEVPPGSYVLRLTFSADPVSGPNRAVDTVAHATSYFTIPDVPGGWTDTPFDLGELRPRPLGQPQVGAKAPVFDVATLDGRRVTLDTFRGKHLLLSFWRSDDLSSLYQLRNLMKIQERFGRNEAFAMLGMSLDGDRETLRAFVETHGIAWPQVFLGHEGTNGLAADYGVNSRLLVRGHFLIGPEGNLVAKDLFGPKLEEAVAKVLNQPIPAKAP
jgi:peroxiredoxin